MSQGGGVWGSSPKNIFGLNGVKSCNVRQNEHGNGTFIKARYSVYDGRRDNPLNLEVIRIFQIFSPCIILASGASQKIFYKNKIKTTFGPPLLRLPIKYPHKTPPLTNLRGGGGPDPRSPPSGSAHVHSQQILSYCKGVH